LSEIAEGGPVRAHPALEALYRAANASAARAMLGVAETRTADMELAPFKTWDALETYVAGTSRGLMSAALHACDVGLTIPSQTGFVAHVALAWAYLGLLRAAPLWAARGRTFLPQGATDADVLARARAAYAEAKLLVR
jgi:phytoene/squalene synthetase